MGKALRSLFTGTGVGSIFRFVRELDLESGVIDNPRRGTARAGSTRQTTRPRRAPPPRPAGRETRISRGPERQRRERVRHGVRLDCVCETRSVETERESRTEPKFKSCVSRAGARW
jgi:hypothetical protein